jgi:hypothetical protein
VLYNAYLRYYRDSSFENARALWDSILGYDFSDDLFNVGRLRRSFSARSHLVDFTLHSNGSTVGPRQFGFGPFSFFWLQHVEDMVKFRGVNKFVYILNSVSSGDRVSHFSALPVRGWSTLPTHFLANVPFEQVDAIPFLIDKLGKVGDFSLTTWPNNWLYLFSDSVFVDFLRGSKLGSAVSTCWESFCKVPLGIHFNDNMVNWSTCMNFYTCVTGVKHFLPIFVPMVDGVVNLLNLSGPAVCPVDDLMVLEGSVRSCRCGRKYLPFSFVPQVRNAIRGVDGEVVFTPELAGLLLGRYMNLQFVQRGGVVDVLYILVGGVLDEEIIRDHFGGFGLVTNFVRDRYFQVGAKLPVFWRVSGGVEYRVWGSGRVVRKVF